MDEDAFAVLLSDHLKIDLENPVIGHMLTNCMKLPKGGMGKISKAHLNNLFTYCKYGYLYRRVNSLKELNGYIPKLETELKSPKTYKAMYNQLYDVYLLESYTTLDYQTAEMLWAAYIKQMSFYTEFFQFLKLPTTKKPPRVHRDLWKMVYEFSINVKTLKDYSEEDAWPILLDQFVDYLKEGK